MVTDLQVLFAVQLFIIFLIAFDARQKRDWMSTRTMILIVFITVLVPVLGAIIYLAVVYRQEGKMVECPECGGLVPQSEDACVHCDFDPEAARQEEEGPHRCGECGEEFETSRGLREHRSKGHDADDTSEEGKETVSVSTDSHACPECGAEFDSERGLHVHESIKHS